MVRFSYDSKILRRSVPPGEQENVIRLQKTHFCGHDRQLTGCSIYGSLQAVRGGH